MLFRNDNPKMEASMAQPATRVEASEQDQPTTNTANKPIDKFIDGPVHVSIWQNTGSRGAFRSASFEIRYKDSSEQWQTGRSYTASNLKHLESAAREARSRIESWQQTNPPEVAPG
jgi:hypothetical protein